MLALGRPSLYGRRFRRANDSEFTCSVIGNRRFYDGITVFECSTSCAGLHVMAEARLKHVSHLRVGAVAGLLSHFHDTEQQAMRVPGAASARVGNKDVKS